MRRTAGLKKAQFFTLLLVQKKEKMQEKATFWDLRSPNKTAECIAVMNGYITVRVSEIVSIVLTGQRLDLKYTTPDIALLQVVFYTSTALKIQLNHR